MTRPFAPEEIEAHKMMNGAGKPWGRALELPSVEGRLITWAQKDRVAHYYDGFRLLAFVTTEYGEKKKAVDKAKRAAADNAKER